MPEPSQNSATRLVGWKRISNHLGCSERTARRWEREEGLPVHRQQHAAQPTVYARIGELESWLASRAAPTKPAHKNSLAGWLPAAAAVAAVVLLGLLGFSALSPSSPAKASGSQDLVAVDLYERGRALWLQRGKEPNTRAVKLLQEAVARDENYAEAWQTLASAWATLPTYSDEVAPQRAFDEALFAADKAVRLDPGLVEARSIMASVAQRRGDWVGSQRIFDEALAQDPENTMLMLWLGEHYRDLGLIEKAKTLLGTARDLEPGSPPVLTALAMYNHMNPDPRLARDTLLSLWNDTGLETPNVWFGIWHVHVRLGDYDAAEQWIAESPVPVDSRLLVDFIRARKSGAGEAITSMEARILSAYEAGFPGWFAYALLDHLGKPQSALAIAEREAQTGRFELSVVMFDPLFPGARQTEQFGQVVKSLGYIEYWELFGAPDFCSESPAPPVCLKLPY